MRTFLAFLLAFIFFFTFPLVVISFSVGHMLTPIYLKSSLEKSGVYEASTASLLSAVDGIKNEENQISIEDHQKVKNFIKKEVTPAYVKDKVELFLDQTFVYLNGNSASPPGIMLSDLKPKVIEIVGNEPLPKEMDNFFSKPITIPQNEAERVRGVYQIFQKLTLPLTIANLILLTLIFLLVKGLKSKLRWVSMTLFIPTLFGLIGTAVIYGFGELIIPLVTSKIADSEIKQFTEPVKNLIKSLTIDLASRMFLIFIITFIVAIVVFIVSTLIKSKIDQSQAIATSTAPIKSPEQPSSEITYPGQTPV